MAEVPRVLALRVAPAALMQPRQHLSPTDWEQARQATLWALQHDVCAGDRLAAELLLLGLVSRVTGRPSDVRACLPSAEAGPADDAPPGPGAGQAERGADAMPARHGRKADRGAGTAGAEPGGRRHAAAGLVCAHVEPREGPGAEPIGTEPAAAARRGGGACGRVCAAGGRAERGGRGQRGGAQGPGGFCRALAPDVRNRDGRPRGRRFRTTLASSSGSSRWT
jgi:hypothetical protein